MPTEQSRDRWTRRRSGTILLRVGAASAPAVSALVISWGIATALPPGPGALARTVWTLGTIATSLAAGALVMRPLRRLAPLAWLLRIDLAFPGEAPSRFAVALTAGRTADLARDLRDGRLATDDRAAAERIIGLAAALTAHHRGTRGHSERVRGYTRLIGESMGIAREDLDRLAWAGLLHDVGKLVVDPDILNKPCRLDDHELVEMRRHPVEGARLAAPLMPWLGDWGLAIAHHHERWDGTGYPAGLSGQRISPGGRIVAVADAFEAMTAHRPYNTPRTLQAAREELVAAAGTHFDPEVVRALLAVPLGRLSRIALPSAALGVLPSVHATWVRVGATLHLGPGLLRQAALTLAGTAVVSTAVVAAGVLPSGGPQPAAVVQPAGEGVSEVTVRTGRTVTPSPVMSSGGVAETVAEPVSLPTHAPSPTPTATPSPVPAPSGPAPVSQIGAAPGASAPDRPGQPAALRPTGSTSAGPPPSPIESPSPSPGPIGVGEIVEELDTAIPAGGGTVSGLVHGLVEESPVEGSPVVGDVADDIDDVVNSAIEVIPPAGPVTAAGVVEGAAAGVAHAVDDIIGGLDDPLGDS